MVGDLRPRDDRHLRGAGGNRARRRLLVAGRIGRRPAGAARPSKNIEAYNANLQGRYFLSRRGRENLEKAAAYFEQALKLDPEYAVAWSGLASVRIIQADVSYVPVDNGYRQARSAVERALTLDPSLAEAHSAMAWIRSTYDWDWAGAAPYMQKALPLDPDAANTLRRAATLTATLGRFEESLQLVRRALTLDPLSPANWITLSRLSTVTGKLDEALSAANKGLELQPQGPGFPARRGLVYLAKAKPQEALTDFQREAEPLWRLQGLALSYHALGLKQQADQALADLSDKYQTDSAFQIAEVYAFRGEIDRAFEWLERAYGQRDGGLAEIKGDPLLKSLEGDPRYVAFPEEDAPA